MHEISVIDKILLKITVRSFSIIGALILIISGIYMCLNDLAGTGRIDVKAVFIDGQIETGSLGLMTIFLATIIILALNYGNRPRKGEKVTIRKGDFEITTNDLSYRKLSEIIAYALNASKETTYLLDKENQSN